MRDRDQVLAELQPYIERARAFSGWAFDDVHVTALDPLPPWDYEAIARERALTARSVLDLGTGGGEVFARIIDGVSARFVAIEEWHVNVPVARARLRPCGVSVLHASSERLPLRDRAFDLVLDRHEALEPPDAARVVAPSGALVTQQVGHDNWPELDEFFPRRTRFPDHYAAYKEGLRAAGMRVEARRHARRVAYPHLGDIVFMLLIAPWDIPQFDPAADIDALLAFEAKHRSAAGIVLTETTYLIVAEAP